MSAKPGRGAMSANTLPEPVLRRDGSCPACMGGNVCRWHQEDGLRRDREGMDNLRRVCASAHAHEIGRICARYELESDEGGTREEKAERILAG